MAREALAFVLGAGVRDIVLGVDDLYVMNAIRSNEDGLSSGGALVVDIGRVGLSCNKLMFSFVR